jgi:hypothetical protein
MASGRSDDTLSTARNLKRLNGVKTIRDSVDRSDKFDFYRFTLNTRSSFSVALNRLKAPVNLRILDDQGRSIARFNQPKAKRGTPVTRDLEAGQYYLRVGYRKGNTRYRLRLAASPPGSPTSPTSPTRPLTTLGAAENIGILSGTATRQGLLNSNNDNDIYRFDLNQITDLEARISGPSSASIDLIFDRNNNGEIDQDDVLKSTYNSFNSSATLTDPLPVGTYFVRIRSRYSSTSTRYDLTLVATPQPGNLPSPAGDTLASAFNVGALDQRSAGTFQAKDYVGVIDNTDYYRFTLSQNGNLEARISGAGNIDMDLIYDFNSNGLVDQDDVIKSTYNSQNSSATFTEPLAAGTYFVRLTPRYSSISTRYDLTLIATSRPSNLSSPPGETLTSAFNVGILDQRPSGTFQANDYVGVLDSSDYYRFTLNQTRELTATISGVQNVQIELISDTNGNNSVDLNEVVRSTYNSQNSTTTFTEPLATGTYFVKVYPKYGGDYSTHYSLSLVTT